MLEGRKEVRTMAPWVSKAERMSGRGVEKGRVFGGMVEEGIVLVVELRLAGGIGYMVFDGALFSSASLDVEDGGRSGGSDGLLSRCIVYNSKWENTFAMWLG